MNKELFVTVAIIAAVAGLLIIGGCTQKPKQQQLLPQQPQAVATPAPQPQITPEAEAEAAQHDLLGKPKSAAADWAQSQQRLGGQSKTEENDLYNDNLNGSIDDLSQLEQ